MTGLRKHTLLVDGDFVGYAVRASPPPDYEGVIKGVTAALETLAGTLSFSEPKGKSVRWGNFRTVNFGCSYGGGQKVGLSRV